MNKICSNSVAEHHHPDKSSGLDRILDFGKLATEQTLSTVEALGNLVPQTVDFLPDQAKAYPNVTVAAPESLMQGHATFHSLHQELPGSSTVLLQSQQLPITPPTTPVDGSLSVV